MVTKFPRSTGKTLGFEVNGCLRDSDYQRLLFPELASAIHDNGRVRLLIEMTDFRGWTLPAAWDDLQVGIRHNRDIERIAVVGSRIWGWITPVMAPFVRGKVRYFESSRTDEAWRWLGA